MTYKLTSWKEAVIGTILAAQLLMPSGASAIESSPSPKTVVSANQHSGGSRVAAVQNTDAVKLTLKGLGIQHPLRLVGGRVAAQVDFSFHTLDVIEKLRFKANYSYSPTLNPELSTLTVVLNGKSVGTLPLARENARAATATIEIDPLLLQEWNHLSLQFEAHLEKPMCDDPRNPQTWIQFDHRGTMIEANAVTLPLSNDLALFPVPFFDKHDTRDLTLPFVLSDHPGWDVLKSAGILASWFGTQTDWRKLHFPTHLNELPEKDAIVLATSGDVIEGIELPSINEGVGIVSVIENPKNPDARLLLIVGRDEKGLVETVQALTLGQVKLEGSSQIVYAPSVAKRRPYDAPNWLPEGKKIKLRDNVQTDRIVSNTGMFGDIVPSESLVATGLFVTPFQMVMKLPPDLHRSVSASIPFDLNFSSSNNSRYLKRIDAVINGIVFQHEEFDEPEKNAPAMVSRQVRINIPTDRITGKDTFAVKYTFADKTHAICNTEFVLDEIRVNPNSTIDLSSLPRYVEMPNLSYLAYSGFPFSKMADLSETAVLMPAKPDRFEIESMLIALGHIGNKTGFPAVALTVASLQDAEKMTDKDILVIGATERLRPLLENWSGDMQVNLLSGSQPIPQWGSRYIQRWAEWVVLATRFEQAKGTDGMVMAGFESPLQDGRSVVVMASNKSKMLPEEASVLNTFNFAKDFIGDVATIAEEDRYNRVTAFERAARYSIGELPWEDRLRMFMHHNPWLSVLAAALIGVFFAAIFYRKFRRISQEKTHGEML